MKLFTKEDRPKSTDRKPTLQSNELFAILREATLLLVKCRFLAEVVV